MASEAEIRSIVRRQRAYFYSGRTLPVPDRVQALERLERAILAYETDLYRALNTSPRTSI